MTSGQNVIQHFTSSLKNKLKLYIIIGMNNFKIFDKLLSLIYPEKCPYCETVIEYDKIKCEKCEKKVEYNVTIRSIVGDYYCISPFIYEGPVKDAIWKFKFRNHPRYSRSFGLEIVKVIEDKLPGMKFSGITYVPLSPQRRRERGYNQAELLAKVISNELNIQLLCLLKKVRDNPSQHRIESPYNRAANVKGVYEPNLYCKNAVHKTIILCDDIVTSGNTMKECIKTLNKAGFKNIICASISSVNQKS